MKKIIVLILLLFSSLVFCQENRIQQLKYNLDNLSADVPGLSQKLNVNVKESTLPSFLLAVSEIHKVNISVDTSLNSILIINNFTDVTVADMLLFLCKEYSLSIDFTGNIIAIKRYEKPAEKALEKIIDVRYSIDDELLSLNLKDDKLYEVFKRITDESGKNIVFSPGLDSKPLSVYLKSIPFDDAMNKLAFANNLSVTKTKDNFYLFEALESDAPAATNSVSGTNTQKPSRPVRSRKSNFYFNVIDNKKKLLDVDFENTPISNIVYDIGNELNIDMFISNPLENAGVASVKAKNITFDELLDKIFESKNNFGAAATPPVSQPLQGGYVPNDSQSADTYTYFRKNDIYFFGLKNQLTLRTIKTIQLMRRSIELLNDPSQEGRSSGRTAYSQNNFYGNGSYENTRNTNTNSLNQDNSETNKKQQGDILSLLPNEIKTGLDIKIDTELNSFIVSGPAENIQRFESFIKYIDKEIPVILIEVMILDVNRSATVETGIKAGIGDKPVKTNGTVFPTADINLGATTINNIINHFDGFGSLNIGKVVPNFYLSLKALETNGNVNIRSTPRLSTLNGHKAYLSIGETTYYVVTNQNFYGSQIPQTSEIKNYQPIDAELSLSIKPLVSGDGEITMDIKVIQSSFNGQKIDKDAPPGINSREFNSILRVHDQDIIILGGLEEKTRNDSGTGVPLLARIPVIKWLFSSRKRENSKKKLSILIKPTVIY
ncbi:type II secretion system protein GspD [Flavobacterium pallidum]|uniref:General secretion pathway protein GspD n=1 Tax=Flavobacterium pallidum TaxID=2172098 RepID=A0A2S1SFY1_9FLAO|nr:general secretion pathway protein GspD [Flavobacterium pallidum]AWI25295.1 general secretion pathway protein GspD [Flavobacterium pallidum]